MFFFHNNLIFSSPRKDWWCHCLKKKVSFHLVALLFPEDTIVLGKIEHKLKDTRQE